MYLFIQHHPVPSFTVLALLFLAAYFISIKILKNLFLYLSEKINFIKRLFIFLEEKIFPKFEITIESKAQKTINLWWLIAMSLLILKYWTFNDIESKTILMLMQIVPALAITAIIFNENFTVKSILAHRAFKIIITIIASAIFWIAKDQVSKVLNSTFGLPADAFPHALYAGTFLWIMYILCVIVGWLNYTILFIQILTFTTPKGLGSIKSDRGQPFFSTIIMAIWIVQFLSPLKTENIRNTLIVYAAMQHDFVQNYRCENIKTGDKALFLGSKYDTALIVSDKELQAEQLFQSESSNIKSPKISIKGTVTCNKPTI